MIIMIIIDYYNYDDDVCVCVRDVYDEDHDDAYTLCQASGVDLELSFS